ncbi:MAG: hypothetical protein ACJA13_002812 [Paraglaciecola sp.]
MSTSPSEPVIQVIRTWLAEIIIGLNFCPFAKREFERNSIRYLVSGEQDNKHALSVLLDELALLDGASEVETTLIIFHKGFSLFDDYLDLVDLANALLEQGGYGGIFQLATFHPAYCFADAAMDDPANFTNRAPYPILHILRESSINRVLRTYPEPESIPDNNIAKARGLGLSHWQELMSRLDGSRDT